MSQKPNKKANTGKKGKPMSATTKLFLAGSFAEIYLLTVYRYYVRGTADQMLAWHRVYLPALPWIGLAMLAIGLVLLYVGSRDCAKKKAAASILVAAGVFLAVTTPMIRVWYDGALTPLCVIVPAAMILGILWHLYDRECVYGLAILCGTLMMLWLCRKGVNAAAQSTTVRALAAGWLAVLAAAALVLRKAQRSGGKVKGLRLLPADADYLPVYIAVGVSAALVLAGMVSATLAYYAMWAAAVVVFAMAVYYTVQQL